MSSFPSIMPNVLTKFLTNRYAVNQSVDIGERQPRMRLRIPVIGVRDRSPMMVLSDNSPTPGQGSDEYPSIGRPEVAGYGDYWFDIIHILPRRIDLGNILTTVTRTIDIYNAFLREPKDLEAFINNAGAGTSITDLPVLPYSIPPQESLVLTLEVTPDGAPTINTTLDFDTEESYLLSIPITGTRIVMFPFEPEAPLVERLQFLTDVFEHKDGTEQRVSLRHAPRQVFDLMFRREDGVEKQRFDILLLDWQSRVFGLPMWHEPTFLTANASAGQTSVSVGDTTLSDFRAGGLAIVYESETKFDALEVSSVGPTTVNFSTPLLNSYSALDGIRVMPLRTAISSVPVGEKKYAVNLVDFEITMRVLDNTVDLSDVSGWPTYSGKVLLSDPNAIDGTLDGQIVKQITVFESDGGKFSQASTWNRSRHSTAKTFVTNNRSDLWKVRKLLHALRGRQVSFYLPSFTRDLTLATTYTSGGSALTIVNVGYSRYARQRTPKVDIRIVLRSGTTYVRSITASSEVDANTEQLTLSSTIAQTIAPADVERIEFFEKVRLDTDEIVIEHRNANGDAKIGFPVRVVLE